MVDLRMLAAPAMWSASVLTVTIAATSGMLLVLIPKLFDIPSDSYGFGASTSVIGLLLLPGTIAGVVAGAVGGLAVQRFGPRAVVTAGAVSIAGTLVGLALVHDAAWQPSVARALTAFAASLITTALLAHTATAVDAKDTGIATSLLVVTRVVGVSLGAQAAGSMPAARIDPVSGQPGESAFVTGFVASALLAAVSLFVVRHMKKGTQS